MIPDLIVRFGGLGDVIMTLGFLRELSQSKKVFFLTDESYKEFLDHLILPNVNWIYTKRPISPFLSKLQMALAILENIGLLAFKHFNTIYFPYYDKRYQIITLLSFRSKIRDLNSLSLNKEIYFGDLLLNFIDKNKFEFPEISLPKSFSKTTILCPGGNTSDLGKFLRKWPIENYKKLAKLLLNEHREFLILGMADDRLNELFPEYKNFIRNIDSLLETAKIFRASDCIVAGDSGLMHLGLLCKTNLIALFGPTLSSRRIPTNPQYSDKIKILEERKNLSCSPCYDGKKYAVCKNPVCMRQITPEAVLEKIKEYENSYYS